MSRIRLIIGALLVLSIGQSVFAKDPNNWVFLGQTTVDGQRDFDRITLGRNEGKFERIYFRVLNAPVVFERVVIHYGNGISEGFDAHHFAAHNGKVLPIDLRGVGQVINYVDFYYREAGQKRIGFYSNTRPVVALYGDKLYHRAIPQNWNFLGQMTVDGYRDYDRITLGHSEGRFDFNKLRVSGAPVEFSKVVIHYGNGTSEEINIHSLISANYETRAFNLQGYERIINSVDFYYSKAILNFRNRPVVSLYGK